MTSNASDAVLDILGAVLDVAPEERSALVSTLCGHDARLRSEVDRLLQLEQSAADAFPDDVNASHWLNQIAVSEHGVDSKFGDCLHPGTVIGRYRVGEMLGSGGMGIVYRATDTLLERTVAIKALSPALGPNTGQLDRFVREAKILASLNHPNVATAYGLEESGDDKFLVMELVEGESLKDRLSRGRLPIAEVISIAAQVASGVSSAHEAGVIHRDLKPGNIMLTHESVAKVLDFGLARERPKLHAADSGKHDSTNSSHSITQEGMIAGTPRYMSPEQLRGRPLDRRSDVFSFGCVLFEMLSGRPAFQGKDFFEVSTALLERDPDFSALPMSTPGIVRRLLRRMLEKDPARRLRDLGDVRGELEEALIERSWASPAGQPSKGTNRRTWQALAVSAACLVAAVWWYVARPQAAIAPALVSEHFVIPFPNDYEQTDLARVRLSIARNGDQILLSASDGEQRHLWQRRRGELSFTSIPDTLGAWIPVLSARGDWVAYFQDGYLMRRRVDGGEAVQVAKHASYAGRVSWDGNNVLFAPVWGEGIVSAGTVSDVPEVLTRPKLKDRDLGHFSPMPTPDRRFILFMVWDGKQGTRIDAIKRDGGARHTVVEHGECPRVVPTPRGLYLLYARRGALLAAPFDEERCLCSGPEQTIVNGILFNRALFEPVYDVADDGTLVYVEGPLYSEQMRLSWIGEGGKATPLSIEPNAFSEPNFASDGGKLSVLVKGEIYRPYVLSLKQQTIEPLVSDADVGSCALSPDGNLLAYSSNRNGPFEVWLHDLQTHTDRVLPSGHGTRYQNQLCWSHDSRHIAFSMASDAESGWDIWVADVESGKTRRFCDRPTEDRSPRFSPDGNWLAYSSDEAGEREIRLRRFPDGSVDKQVTPAGAEWPQWSPDGKTLYFRKQQELWSVPISLQDASVMGPPEVVHNRDFGQSDSQLGDYTVGPDGRILIIEPSEQGPRAKNLHVLLHWYNALNP
jgi:eukaryotic-like serine/threonine-protein kinase